MSNEKHDPEGPPLVVWCRVTGDWEDPMTCPDCEYREECIKVRR